MAVALTLFLTDFNFCAEVFHSFLYLIVRGVGINVHGGLDIPMSHNCLDYLHITLILAEPGTECVPEDVRGKSGSSSDPRFSLIALSVSWLL